MKNLLAATLMLALAPLAAHAQAPEEGLVTVVVAIPTPFGASRSAIEAGIQKSIPQYRAVPGLLRKYFTIGDGVFGGVYLFASRAAAQNWFNDAWSQRIVKTYGAPAMVTYYNVPVVLDNTKIPAKIPASARSGG